LLGKSGQGHLSAIIGVRGKKAGELRNEPEKGGNYSSDGKRAVGESRKIEVCIKEKKTKRRKDLQTSRHVEDERLRERAEDVGSRKKKGLGHQKRRGQYSKRERKG